MVLGEGVVEGRGSGSGVGGELLAGALPFLVQRIDVVERGVQFVELVAPAVLYRVASRCRAP
ncbi:hypothetical protein [Streptomyces sp. NPDC056405]|uniref:hypothetical protein n=1 Tax=Streptomyces sp. NPDC056405 TaxID=3345811 RepID=UPI0035E20074